MSLFGWRLSVTARRAHGTRTYRLSVSRPAGDPLVPMRRVYRFVEMTVQ